jgi:hypothetical protein
MKQKLTNTGAWYQRHAQTFLELRIRCRKGNLSDRLLQFIQQTMKKRNADGWREKIEKLRKPLLEQ